MSRSVRLVGAALIPAFTLPIATSAVARSADVPPPPVNRNLPKELDVASPYIPQSVCDPDPKPGVTAFARLMANHYDEFNYGISRACNYGLTEHSEGRALDWMLNAYDPHERAVADGVIAWLLAPDSEGRPAAMARRFGVMYIIWNRQIWGTYQMSTGWRPYNGVSPHTDHIHFSFSWDGAMQRTSWWTGKAWTGVTTTPGGPSMPIPDPTEYPTLRVGSSGPDVKLAQEVIGVTADGAFGPATQTALKTWQRTNGVKVTGVLDDATWNRMVLLGKIPARGSDQGGDLATHMKTSIRLGSTGEAVKALQRVLGLKVDGTFGPATNTAVRNFQKDRQLRVDGFVTQNVWKALAGVPYVKNGTVPKPKPEPEKDHVHHPTVASPKAPAAPTGAVVVTKTQFAAVKSTVLASGARGGSVKVLQRALGGVAVDGAFGSGTARAVRSFQRAAGLSATGVVDGKTWDALEAREYPFLQYRRTVLKPGSTGYPVKVLQTYLGVRADGAFGTSTRDAVRALQGRHGLARTGYVGGVTWQALEREVRARRAG
ncbi:peptidoglycan-binding domain-containing protein [Janibacter terrae]|uniref:peptidoglycan-binding domain-containing protein n=1 Tax=Janibacter terrae TaxID=103817 RepID=UPI0008383076|nr:peptidoglycan-binding protein [Janibacter terrae]